MFLVLGSWFLACRADRAIRSFKNQEPRTKSLCKTAFVAACLAACSTASGPAFGQEETIFDPENPAVSGEESVEGEEGEKVELAEPRLKPIEQEEVQPSNASFLGAYATSLGVDTAWEGGDEDIVEWTNELELRLEYDMPGQSRAVVEGEFWHWMVGKENPDETDLLINATEGRASYEPRLGEAYVLLRDDNLTFRIGNLVTPWGSTDIVRPGDVINPTDLTRIETVTATSDLLLPQFTAELSYSQSDWSITGLLVPFFEENDAFVFGRDFALVSPFNPIIGDQLPILLAAQELIDRSRWDDVQDFFAATRVPDEIPKNVSLGARATATAWNTDFGLGYFYGWDRTPWLEIDEDLRQLFRLAAADGQVLGDFDLLGFVARNPQALGLTAQVARKASEGEELLATEYKRRHTVVADVARYIGPIGVRADMVFTPEQTFFTDEFESLRRTTLFGALGFSWERFESEDDILAVTVEGFWLHPFDRNSAINETFVATDERGPEDAEILLIGDDLYGAAAALQWTVPLIDADLQIGALGTLSTEDVVGTASLGKQWYSWLNTTVSVTVLEGPDPSSDEPISLGGLYDHNDQLTLTVDGVF